jgi:hypothetical protein
VPVPGTDLERDEAVRPDTSLEKLAKLTPSFQRHGTVTAGNASPLNDGAGAMVVADDSYPGDPIARIVSHYTHRTVNWPDMGTLEQALEDPHIREWLVTPSRYGLQLERYLACFPPEQILVVDSDELHASRVGTLAKIFDFLGVDSSFYSQAFGRVHNEATGRVQRNRTGEVVSTLLERTLGRTRSQALRERTPRALKAPFRYEAQPATLSDRSRRALEEELREDAERLRAHTGLAFAGWTV